MNRRATGRIAAVFSLSPFIACAIATIVYFLREWPPGLGAAIRSIGADLKNEFQFPTHTVVGVLTAGFMWLTAMGIGQWMLDKFEATAALPTLWARWGLATLTGWIPISLATLIAGLGGLTERPAMAALLIIGAAWAMRGWSILWWDLRAMELRQTAGSLDPSDPNVESDAPPKLVPVPPRAASEFNLPAWVLLPAFAIYLITLPYAATPGVESDELRYHLAAPATWILDGRIHYLPHQAFSNFPFLTEALYLMAMALQGTEAARVIHLTFLEPCAIFVGLIAFMALRLSVGRWKSGEAERARNIAAVAGLAFASIPVAIIVACWGFNDLALTAYVLATIYLGALWLVARTPPPPWLAGAMAGAAFSTKYSMIPMLGAVFVLLLLFRIAMRRRGAAGVAGDLKYAAIAGLVALAVASPWYLKNWRWTGNPVYPMAHGAFDGGDWSEANAKFFAAKAAEKGYPAKALYEDFARGGRHVGALLGPRGETLAALATPITTSLRFAAFEGHFLGPITLVAIPAAVFGAVLMLALTALSRGRNARRPSGVLFGAFMALLILGGWMFWYLTYRSNRMALPVFGVMLAAAGWGVGVAVLRARIKWLNIGAAFMALLPIVYSLLWSWSWIAGSERMGQPYAVAFGLKPRRDYLDERVAYHASTRALASLMGDKSRAILIGEHRTLYFPKGAIASDWFDTPQPLPWIRKSNHVDDMLDKMLAEDIEFVFFNRRELSLYHDAYFRPRFSPEEYDRFEQMIGYASGRPHPRLEQIFEDTGREIVIYKIKAQGA